MKLCLASLHPRILSGQIDSLAGLGRALDRRGHNVRLVAPFDAEPLLHEALADLDGGPKGLPAAAQAMLKAVPRIVSEGNHSDILHLALPTPAFSWVADMVGMACKAPVLVTFEGHLAQAAQVLEAVRRPQSLKSRLPLWLVNNGLFGRLSIHRCQRYVVSSEYQRHELIALGVPADRISVLTNIVEDSKLEMTDPAGARRLLGLPAKRPMVGYIGHFNDVKGVDVLAEAFARLIDTGNDFELALAWSGQRDAASIRRRLAPVSAHVTWLGKVHVGSFLSAIDVLALPYRSTAGQGAYPSLVLEALHLGRPL
ncbi:MAG: glycosyltransferase family 4 protein, partial [Chloroflexi bacterium]|nr:glycosyltransferase family 4 protein [Chloroflexota bacterium]